MLSKPEPAAGTAADPTDRYVDLGPIGIGGMGEVRAVADVALGRQVARKVPRVGVAGADEALRNEARITAALEHPGIIPVYDAGADASGRPWYTMRLVRGRSLRAIVDATPELSHRLALLRPVLGAIEAVAYAHARGVVHCDLKSTNVLLGEHGEVQVLDWGLAVQGHRHSGGTPATMAPEQARGEPATTRSDVWGLGLLLQEVLSGTSPTAVDTLEPRPEPAPLPATVPVDLAAIVHRCLRAEPGERYPDAGALAADLASFLDGHLVSSHSYTTGERVVRFLARHRGVVQVAALALLVVLAVAVVAGVRTIRERDVARAAAEEARQARARSDASLAQALVLGAQNASSRGARAEAEVLAVEALQLAESAEARGVLVQYAANPRPARREAGFPTCDGVWVGTGPDGLCVSRDAVARKNGEREVWRFAETPSEVVDLGSVVVVTQPGNSAAVLDRETGAPRARLHGLPSSVGLTAVHGQPWLFAGRALVTLAGAAPEPHSPCASEVLTAIGELPGGELLVACAYGQHVAYDPKKRRSRPLFEALSLPPDDYTTSLATSAGGVVAIGTFGGRVALFAEERLLGRAELGSSVLRLTWTGDGQRLAVNRRKGPVAVLHGRTAALVGDLPLAAGPVGGRAGLDGVWTPGRGGEIWSVGALTAERVLAPSGLGAITAGPQDDIVVGRGDAMVARYDLRTGEELAAFAIGGRPVKAVVTLPDGYAAVGVEGGVYRTGAGLSSPSRLSPVVGRRLVRMGDGLLLLGYGRPGEWLDLATGKPTALMRGTASWFDVGTNTDATRAAALGDDRTLWLVTAGSAERVGPSDAVCVDLLDDGRIALGERTRIVVRSADGAEQVLPIAGALTDLAVSPGDRWLAAGFGDGTVEVHDLQEQRLAAVLRGHSEQIGAVAFDGPGRLLSASWDRTARRWALDALVLSPEVLGAQIEAAWGLSVEEALVAAAP